MGEHIPRFFKFETQVTYWLSLVPSIAYLDLGCASAMRGEDEASRSKTPSHQSDSMNECDVTMLAVHSLHLQRMVTYTDRVYVNL